MMIGEGKDLVSNIDSFQSCIEKGMITEEALGDQTLSSRFMFKMKRLGYKSGGSLGICLDEVSILQSSCFKRTWCT